MVSFFDKELALMRFNLKEGEEPVNMEVLLSTLGSSKDAEVRAKCLKALNDGLGGPVGRVAALSLSTVAGSWHIEGQERKYTNLRTQRNLSNNCPDEVVDSLLLGVRRAGVPLCKRFYTLKKNILKQTQGLETFRWSDRNAPIDIDGDSRQRFRLRKVSLNYTGAQRLYFFPVLSLIESRQGVYVSQGGVVRHYRQGHLASGTSDQNFLPFQGDRAYRQCLLLND